MALNSNTTVLVTGGAGFIGSHLVRRLLHDGFQVRVLDNFVTGKHANLDEVSADIELIEGDVADIEIARRAAMGVECVFHQAAIPSVPRSISDPLGCHHATSTGTITMLTAAREADVQRFVYAASSSAYGDTDALVKEESLPTNPRSPYAVAKLSGEQYCRSFYRVYGMETVALRYFNIFGPRQDPTSEYSAVIPRFITAILEGRGLTIYGDGLHSRDFTYIDNVVQANLKAMTAPDAVGEVLNIGCGESFTLNQLVASLGELLQKKPSVTYGDRRSGDVLHSLADIGKAKHLLGYEPEVPFLEGLRRTVDYFQSQHLESANKKDGGEV